MAMSMAAYAARAGLRSVALVDAALEEGGRVLDAIEWVGGRAVGVSGLEARWTLLADAERSLGWRAVSNRSTPPIGSDPIAIEGYRTIAYEIAEQLSWSVPDLVAVPSALGDGIQGIWRGFRDLATWGVVDATPRMVAVEVGGAVASSLAGGKDWVPPSGEVHSLARSLGGITGTVQTLQAVVESEGLVVRVTDAELETARIVLGESEGVWAELGAAAGLAAAQKLSSRGDIPARAHFVAVVTEHGLLDEMAQVPPMLETVDARVDELLRVLAVRGE
jgi:threonine synthase